MKEIRVNTIINNDIIKLKELEGHLGKKAEIIILLQEEEDKEIIKNMAGALSEYADTKKLLPEENIWDKIVEDRHGIR